MSAAIIPPISYECLIRILTLSLNEELGFLLEAFACIEIVRREIDERALFGELQNSLHRRA
jgi:hypothetical protein